MSLLANVDWNSILQPPGLPVMMVILVMGVVGLAAILAPQLRKAAELRLKGQMVLRCFTADEISSVLDAGGHHRNVRHRDVREAFVRPEAG